jgi:nucleotidyltransferase substrate binding protein (TIGR01987 family)
MSAATLDLGSLRAALLSLVAALGVVADEAWFAGQSPAVRDTLIAGVIQNFEFVYELGVKMLKRRIELDAINPVDVDGLNYRDLLRVAGENGLIANVPAWFGYRQMRNITAHTYDHAKARQVHRDILTFVADARALLDQLEAGNV